MAEVMNRQRSSSVRFGSSASCKDPKNGLAYEVLTRIPHFQTGALTYPARRTFLPQTNRKCLL